MQHGRIASIPSHDHIERIARMTKLSTHDSGPFSAQSRPEPGAGMTGPSDHAALTPALRWIADALGLWGLCARLACRRGRACRRAPRDCLARYAPLVPQDAREGLKAMLDAKAQDWTFDDLMDDARHEVLALAAWVDAVAASNAPRRGPKARPGANAA
jgi:hypothetical protein